MLRRMLAGLGPRRGKPLADAYRHASAARQEGDWARAIDWYRRALTIDPRHAESHNDLGIALCQTRDFAGARAAFTRALEIQPQSVPANVNLGQLLLTEFRDYRQAALHLRLALASDPQQGQARNQLAVALYELGLVEEALACLDEASRRAPDDAEASQFRLFMSNALPRRDLDAWYGEHCAWGARFMDSFPRFAHAPLVGSPRLRIGYVSADLREHATAAFVRPILSLHDRARFEIFCYSNSAEADATTEALARAVDRWRAIDGLDDHQAARLIRGDAVNILVDLSGHTRGGRPGVFARKPAPLQIGYLGYLNTSGMAAMDYRISDSVADPPGYADRLHREALLRLPRTQWCFQPPQEALPVSPPPSLRKGHITFGSFNHIAKLNESVLDLWAELLGRLPGSRLRVLAVPDAEAGARTLRPMQQRGIAPARIDLVGRLARDAYWRSFGEVDIALDPFPYTGGATSCETLWMGVPLVSLAGAFGFGRSGASVLVNAGFPDFVATDERAYLGIATKLAQDTSALARLRSSMRERLARSPLLAAPDFVRALEDAYCELWQRAVAGASVPC